MERGLRKREMEGGVKRRDGGCLRRIEMEGGLRRRKMEGGVRREMEDV